MYRKVKHQHEVIESKGRKIKVQGEVYDAIELSIRMSLDYIKG